MYKYLKENRSRILLLPLILYWILLFIGTTLPAAHLADVIGLGDKIKHFGAYLVLAVLLAFNLHFQEKWENVAKNYLLYTFIICSTYGVLDELHQIYIPNRTGEFLDWLADLIGTISGVGLTSLFIKRLKNKANINETN